MISQIYLDFFKPEPSLHTGVGFQNKRVNKNLEIKNPKANCEKPNKPKSLRSPGEKGRGRGLVVVEEEEEKGGGEGRGGGKDGEDYKKKTRRKVCEVKRKKRFSNALKDKSGLKKFRWIYWISVK